MMFLFMTITTGFLAKDCYAYESENLCEVKDDNISIEELEKLKQDGALMNITKNGSGTFYEITTTDKSTLQQYQEPNKGELVARTVTYFIPEEHKEDWVNCSYSNQESKEIDTITRAITPHKIKNWKCVDPTAYIESNGISYQIEDPINFKLSAKTKSYWEIHGNVTLKIKEIIEDRIGGKAGKEHALEWTIDVDAPSGYYRDIRVWEYLNKYTFDIYFGNRYISSGSAHRPNNRLRIVNNLYRK